MESGNSDLKRKIITSVFWLFGTRYVAQGISWLITILVARLLSPSDYGLMGMAMIYIGFLDFVNEFGVGSALIQKQNLTEEEINSSFWVILFLSGLMYLFTFYFAPLIAHFFNNPQLIPIIRILGLGFIINAFKIVPYNLMTKELRFDKRSKAELISNVSAAIITLLCALNGFGVWSLVFGYLSLNSILTLFLYAFFPWKPKFFFVLKKVSYIIRFGTTLTGSRLLWYCHSRSDSFIIGKIFGGKSLGYYSLAQTLATTPIEKITTILLQIMFPAFSKLQKDNQLLANYFLKTTNVVASIMFPILTAIFLIADDLVPLLLTEKWVPMIPLLKIFCLAGSIQTISVICSPLVISIGKPHIDFFYNLFSFIVMPIGFFIGAQFGLVTTAYAWLTVYPFTFLLMAKLTLRSINLSAARYFQQLKYPIINTLLMAAAILLFQRLAFYNSNLIGKLLFSCILGTSVYIFFSFLFDPKLLREIKDSILLAAKRYERQSL